MVSLTRLKKLLSYEPHTGIFRWIAAPSKVCHSDFVGRIAGTKSRRGYVVIRVDGGFYKAHRLAWFYVTGAWPKEDIDHKNSDKGDNRFQNLREATRQENNRSKPPQRNSRSGVTGIGWRKRERKWLARITVDKKHRYLGLFHDKQAAIRARRDAEIELFGDFAPMAAR